MVNHDVANVKKRFRVSQPAHTLTCSSEAERSAVNRNVEISKFSTSAKKGDAGSSPATSCLRFVWGSGQPALHVLGVGACTDRRHVVSVKIASSNLVCPAFAGRRSPVEVAGVRACEAIMRQVQFLGRASFSGLSLDGRASV